jgi:hypothetical protein
VSLRFFLCRTLLISCELHKLGLNENELG